MDSTEQFYTGRINFYRLEKLKADKKSKQFSGFRLLCFFALAFCIYQCFVSPHQQLFIISSVALFIAFLGLIKLHDKVQRHRDRLERMLLINTNELNVIRNKASELDNGQKFFSTNSYYYDLDIFGTGSVYHLLNRTGTSIGSAALAQRLKNPLLDADTIQQHQQAIKELSQKTDFRQNILATALSDTGKTTDINYLKDWANNSVNLSKKWWKLAVILAPALFALILLYSIFAGNYYWVTLIYFVNLGACYFISRGINHIYSKLSGASKLLSQYADIFTIISNDKPESQIASKLYNTASSANKPFKSLASIINLFDQRMNLLVAAFINPIFFYDLHCVMQLERWKKNNAANIEKWFDCLAQTEVLNSFATFAFNNPQYVFPNISDNNTIIHATQLAHPLIASGKRVDNNVEFGAGSKVILITGSNMSGKSTFLRTVGVNMLLASCGAPVCARQFTFYPVKVYTSLRQSDSLQEDTSFFYAELKKLSEIVKNLETGEKAIVLLDEVLKGTNSDDKTYGSQQLIRRLVHFNALSLIATHDITLGRMENEYNGTIENYCFESTIENNELLFDYKLHKGIAVNKNATFLMKKMGIIDDKQ